ncbi:uncharacterized protein LOC133172548 [Saccostrea echinata]|uniref:uncharacterized protein LOC133172548 n=1 Tax=Saccostrea echinata TaxID=191078 RepID=UPI002A82C525|nr:uncharacterized protein LOC133172548 [Saccostrea echinata]
MADCKVVDIVDYISSRLEGNPLCKGVRQHLLSITSTRDVKANQIATESWLRWARHENHLKVISAGIPIGVLPNGLEGEIIDVKVFARRGPDDVIYDKNKEIRKRVARGNSFLHIDRGPEAGTRCVLQAMKKFTGGLGDDDDRDMGDNLVWKKYFTKPIQEAEKVIATKKANGEAAHLSCCMIDGEYIMCGGSKNVHMMFRTKEDIQKYGEPRFRIAREVCTTVVDSLDKMGEDAKHRLLEFMAWSGYTAVFEILAPDHQHIVNLSYLSGPELKFITWTKFDLNPTDDDCLGAIPPHIGIEIANALGLSGVSYDVISTSDLDERMTKIRREFDCEGEVLYFMDQQGEVIGLLKKKTVWYIMCRAIREKLRSGCTVKQKQTEPFSLPRIQTKMEKRIDEIQRWLSLDDETTQDWKNLANKFLSWTLNKFEVDFTWDNIIDKYPVTWKQFLEENNETDRISVKCYEASLKK